MIKPYRFFAIAVLVLLSIGFAINFTTYSEPTETHETSHANLQQVIPDAIVFNHAKSEFPIYEALDSNQNIIGYTFDTKYITNDISGYGGAPIEMLVGVDQHGNIIKIQLVKHQETPGFMSKIQSLLDQVAGKNIKTPLQLGENIDGISGATITSTAIINTINESVKKIAPIINQDITVQKINPNQRNILIMLMIMLGLFFLAGLTCTAKSAITRWTALTTGFLTLGIVLKEMLSTSHFAGLALSQNPSWDQAPLLHLLLIGALIGSLLLGRIYCAGVCPFAFVEEFLFQINRKFFKLTLSPNAKTDSFCRWIKYIILIIILIVCFWLKHASIGATEIYITLFSGKGLITSWMLISIVLFSSFFFLRFWCKYLCPCGAFLALIAQLRFYNKSATPPSEFNMCADPAECFYCDQCSRDNLSKSTKKQNTFFIVMIVFSTIIFAASFFQIIETTKKQDFQIEKTIAPIITQAYSDSENAKQELQKAGIIPHPAKYWSTIDNEQ